MSEPHIPWRGSAGDEPAAPPRFSQRFRDELEALLAWRRDVRRFRTDPVPEETLDQLLDLAQLSPSVGNSQPWRWVRIESAAARFQVRENFRRCNAAALASYDGDRARLYASLKLEGLEAAPVQFAVFSDRGTAQGHGLGRASMPEVLDYSAVASIMTFWLAARAQGIGVGWVSIIDPDALMRALDVPAAWRLVAYLCVGWPVEDHADPELERRHWQARTPAGRLVERR